MKKLGKLKLDQVCKRQLSDAEKSLLIGGHSCGCGCNGSSSTYDNQNWNAGYSYSTSGGGAKTCWIAGHYEGEIHYPWEHFGDNFG